MSTFDITFDQTFRELLVEGGDSPVQTGCRREGVYLTWLTLQGGWQYWLFEGSVIRGQSSSSRGQYMQGGLSLDTQKDTAPTMTLHTANLTESEADMVGTIRESISAFILQHNPDNSITRIRVKVPTGDAQLWDSQTYTNNFSINIILPSRRSQRL